MARCECFGTSKKALKQRVQAQEEALKVSGANQTGANMSAPTLATSGNLSARVAQTNPLLAAVAAHQQAFEPMPHHSEAIIAASTAHGGTSSLIQIHQPAPEVTIRQPPPQISVANKPTHSAYHTVAPAQTYTASIPFQPAPATSPTIPFVPVTTVPVTPLSVTTLPMQAAPVAIAQTAAPSIAAASSILMPATVMMQQQPHTTYVLHKGFVNPQAGNAVALRAGCPLGQLYNSTSAVFPDLMTAGRGSAHIHHHHHICRRHR